MCREAMKRADNSKKMQVWKSLFRIFLGTVIAVLYVVQFGIGYDTDILVLHLIIPGFWEAVLLIQETKKIWQIWKESRSS